MGNILNYIHAEFRELKECGLASAEKVKSASNEYFEEMDFIQSFINECCEVGEGEKDSLGELYKCYVLYAKSNGERELTKYNFSSKLRAKNYNSHKGALGKTFMKGIRINNNARVQFSTGYEKTN